MTRNCGLLLFSSFPPLPSRTVAYASKGTQPPSAMAYDHKSQQFAPLFPTRHYPSSIIPLFSLSTTIQLNFRHFLVLFVSIDKLIGFNWCESELVLALSWWRQLQPCCECWLYWSVTLKMGAPARCSVVLFNMHSFHTFSFFLWFCLLFCTCLCFCWGGELDWLHLQLGWVSQCHYPSTTCQ